MKGLMYKVNLQLFAEDNEHKEDDKKSPYDVLLEDNNNLRKEMDELKKKFNDMYDFNKALLSRREQPVEDTQKENEKLQHDKALNEKFGKWLKEN